MQNQSSSLPALTLGAIGVVFGDIGTSVLYTVKEIFATGHVQFTHHNVYGVLSLIFWTLRKVCTTTADAAAWGCYFRCAMNLRKAIQFASNWP